MPKDVFEVICPSCDRINQAKAGERTRRCPICSTEFAIAYLPETSTIITELQDLRKKVTNNQNIDATVANSLDVALMRMESFFSRARSPIGKTTIPDLDFRLVPIEMVNEIAVTDLESGLFFGVFSLFLGLTVQEIFSGQIDTEKFFLLVIFTILSGAASFYFYQKVQRKRKEISQIAENSSVPVELILQASEVPAQE